MSYVSGFMMGAAIGKGVRQFFSGKPGAGVLPHIGRSPAGGRPVAPQEIEAPRGLALVSRIPGRRRYRAPLTPQQAQLLEGELRRLAFLQEVRVSALTGSLLFRYAPQDEKKMDEVEAILRERIFRSASLCPPESAVLPLEAHAGALTRSVRGSMRDFSAWIQCHTGGWLDVSSAAFLLFLLRGVRKMVMTKIAPSGAQMLWWAVSLMRGWRTI